MFRAKFFSFSTNSLSQGSAGTRDGKQQQHHISHFCGISIKNAFQIFIQSHLPGGLSQGTETMLCDMWFFMKRDEISTLIPTFSLIISSFAMTKTQQTTLQLDLYNCSQKCSWWEYHNKNYFLFFLNFSSTDLGSDNTLRESKLKY